MKRLIVVRHAKSDWQAGVSDFDRPLNKRGNRVAPKMTSVLQEMQGVPDAVICSPANRTRQTASLLLNGIVNPEKIIFKESIYEAGFYDLLTLINNDTEDNVDTLMLIGHNPGVSDLVEYLSSGNVGWMPTCSCVCLSADVDSWELVGKDMFSVSWNIYPKMFEF